MQQQHHRPDMRSHFALADEMNCRYHRAPLAKSPNCASHKTSASGSAGYSHSKPSTASDSMELIT
jgi:hypothetical protein